MKWPKAYNGLPSANIYCHRSTETQKKYKSRFCASVPLWQIRFCRRQNHSLPSAKFIATEALKTQKKYKSRFCASVSLWQIRFCRRLNC